MHSFMQEFLGIESGLVTFPILKVDNNQIGQHGVMHLSKHCWNNLVKLNLSIFNKIRQKFSWRHGMQVAQSV